MLSPVLLDEIVARTLAEDSAAGDVTTEAIAEPRARAKARAIAKAPQVVCGSFVAERVFRRLDPEVVFVARSVATSTLTLGVYVVALVAMAVLTGVRVQPAWLLLALVLALFVCFCFGIALVLSVTTVFFRDITQVVAIVLQFWFWLTPIVYHPKALGPRLSAVMGWNPLTPFIVGVRSLLLEGVVPEAERSKYTVAFAGDGTFSATADCNTVNGTWTASPEGGLTIVPGASTIVGCEEGSLGDLYVLALTNSASYAIADDGLTITLVDGGTLGFEAAP